MGTTSMRPQSRPNEEESQTSAPFPLHKAIDPEINALATEVIGRIADKWTMVVLDLLAEHGELRFSRLAQLVDGISQKMLTKTVRQMERDGLLTRTIHPVIPPRVDYKLTDLGMSLGAAFCSVWIWAEENHARVEAARQQYDAGAEKE